MTAPETVEHGHTHAMPGGNPFKNKLGPLPVAVWAILIVGVGSGIYLLMKRRGGAKSVSTDATAATDNTGSGVDTDGSTDAASGAWSANTPANSGGSVTGVNGTPASSDNSHWAANVANGMIAAGSDPTVVQNALSDYLNGRPLTPQEQAIINTAVQKYGVPPEGVLPVKVTQPPPVTPHPTPTPAHPPQKVPPKKAPAPKPHPTARTYIVQPGDNLSAIAHKFYGTANWQKIYNANKSVIGVNPNLIKPGMHLVIPA